MNPIYEIGPFRLEPKAGLLLRDGVPTPLGPRGVAVLTALVERANEHVPKASIIDAAWPGLVVEENNLAAQIKGIRRVLAQATGGERWVETLARRGYRFVGPVTELVDSDGPTTRSVRARSNLTQPRTSFVGRERELAEVRRLLPAIRLLTFVGTGGIGKTRLALRIADEMIDAYRDGVWLADLGAINDPALVVTSVAQLFGVRELGQKAVLDALSSHVRSRRLLLVLDNCEHLLGACGKLASALLVAGREITIIATSREPLRVAGEQVYALSPLALPDPTASPEIAACSEAVQLFLERARAAGPSVGSNGANASMAAICRRLDGLPLAIEMAAARAPTLGLEKLRQKLEDSFRLLTLGRRTALPRQETLRATLDWSYGLLAEPERAVFRRLAVFRGSFPPEAASAVACDEDIDELDVLDLISQLVARSLIVADVGEGGARYRLLEIVRTYGYEKLAEAEETSAIQRRHAGYFCQMFEHAPDDWLRIPNAQWRSIYVMELDNVRAALDWAASAEGDPTIYIALASASGQIWSDLSFLSEGRRRLEIAVSLLTPQAPKRDEARLWSRVASIRFHDAPSIALDAADRVVEIHRRLGEPVGLGIALADLSPPLAFLGRFDEAGSALAEAFPRLEGVGLPTVLARYYSELGFVATLKGDPTAAVAHYEKALALYRRGDADTDALRMLINLAHVAWALGDLDAALARCREAIGLLRQLQPKNNFMLGFTLAYVMGIQTERGELDEALTAAAESLPLLDEAGCAWNMLDDFALLAARCDKLAGAARAVGYTDAAYAAKAASRPPHVAQSRARVEALLDERLSSEAREEFLAQGAKMTEHEACRAVLE